VLQACPEGGEVTRRYERTLQADLEAEALTYSDVYADDAASSGEAPAETIARLERRFDELGPDGCESLAKRRRPSIMRHLKWRLAHVITCDMGPDCSGCAK